MNENERRAMLRKQIDAYHACALEYDSDTLMAQVAYDLAIADLEAWNLRGLVPMSVWIAMTDAQQHEVKEMWHFRAVLQMGMGGVLALLGVIAYAASSFVAIIAVVVMSCFVFVTLNAYFTDTSHGWDAMRAPGTASSLKHTMRLYTEANAQLTRRGMRGALTAHDGVQTGGGLTVTSERGALEVCDEP